MSHLVAQLATEVKTQVAQSANDTGSIDGLGFHMAQRRNQRRRQPRRPHFIPEWAERKGYESQADLVEALGADKSVVSRWYAGASPSEDWQKKLVTLFHCEEPDGIFRHPDEDWFARFFRGRPADEVERIKQTLETAFPAGKPQKQ